MKAIRPTEVLAIRDLIWSALQSRGGRIIGGGVALFDPPAADLDAEIGGVRCHIRIEVRGARYSAQRVQRDPGQNRDDENGGENDPVVHGPHQTS